MRNIFRKIGGNDQGTALMVALLVMGVLISVSMALSGLIFRETRVVKGLIDAGRAYYAAESGIEEALYYLNNELPGWEKDPGLGEIGDSAVFEYRVKNKCKNYPCYDGEDYDLASIPLEEKYGILELNENITIPLFTVSSTGEIESVQDFTVEFFAAFDASQALVVKNVTGWDVLRWKVFGMKNVAGDFVTESISDFTAISSALNNSTGETLMTNAERPSWFGTKACEGNDGIVCSAYQIATNKSEGGQNCSNIQVRDYYVYVGDEVAYVKDCYSIEEFMKNHQPGVNDAQGLNYLSLTNMMNPAVFDVNYLRAHSLEPKDASRIYFRIETDEEIVREVADIRSDGYSGGSKQSISVQIRRGGYMPVFNFSIYSTYKTEAEKGKWDE